MTNRTPLSSETRSAILAEIRAGHPYADICARLGVATNTVSKIALKNGLRRNAKFGILNGEQEAAIAARYTAGEKSDDLAAELGISRDLVWETLRRLGVDRRGMGPVQRPLRHDALDVLTPDAAYWCGFIFTDGTVVHRHGQQANVAVVLQKRDREHLVKLRDFLGSDHAITPVAPAVVPVSVAAPNGGQGTGAFRYSVRSQQLADRLLALGRYGPAVDPELAASRDFWRGCVDGDGTLGVSCGVPQLKLVGSQWLMNAFVDFLGPVSSRRPLHARPARSIFVVSTSYRTAEKVVGRLYAGAGTVLDRKAARAAEILARQAA